MRISTVVWFAGLLFVTPPVLAAQTGAPIGPSLRDAAPDLPDGAARMLEANRFVVLGDVTRRTLHEAYPEHVREGVFVTTDAMLRVWYEVYTETLKAAERHAFAPSLASTVRGLGETARRLRRSTRTPDGAEALRRCAVLLAVAERLSGASTQSPADLRDEVEDTVARVLAHREVQTYPGDDYTQYTVRGHYAGDPVLGRYFRAAMWLSRQFMAVEPGSALQEAVALAAVLRADPADRKRLAALNRARAALGGSPNAVSVEQLLNALDRLHGANWAIDRAIRPAALRLLCAELAKPTYVGTPIRTRTAVAGYPRKVIALVPDCAVPDGVLMQQTVDGAIAGRSLPTGLEVAAALGSPAAVREIEETDAKAREVLLAVRRTGAIGRDDGRSVYSGWLTALSTLSTVDRRAPAFMHNAAWEYAKLNTCMAGWAQIRHANILYAAPTYSTTAMDSSVPAGLVEPNPPFFRALASLADRTLRLFRSVGQVPDIQTGYLKELADLSRRFAVAAEAELSGTLTDAQARSAAYFGAWLWRFQFSSRPIAADVATGSLGEVLHAAVGDFCEMRVAPFADKPALYTGWVSSYYSVVRPDSDRLTDQRWQAIYDNLALRPDRPRWAGQFVWTDRTSMSSREPIRRAERLSAAGKPAEALRVLEAARAAEPDTELAVECGYRIGRHYYRAGRKDLAETEWRACLAMVGCDARDRALEGVREITGSRLPSDPSDVEDRQKRAGICRTLSELRATTPASRRGALERRCAIALLRNDIYHGPFSPGVVLPAARDLCRDPVVREALEFAAVRRMAQSLEDQHVEAITDVRQRCLALARSTRSRLVVRACLATAVRLGYLNDQPMKAARLLERHMDKRTDQSPTGTLLREAWSGRHISGNDLEADWRNTVGSCRGELSSAAWSRGRLEEAIAIERLLEDHPDTTMTTILDQGVTQMPRRELAQQKHTRYDAEYADYSDYGRRPLRMYARACALYGGAYADALVAIVREYPHARIAPMALHRAHAMYRVVKDAAKAARLAALAAERYPDHPVGLYHRIQRALDSDRLDEGATLAARLDGRLAQADAEMRGAYSGVHPQSSSISAIRATIDALRPVLSGTKYAGLLRSSACRSGLLRVEAIADAAPAVGAKAMLALLRLEGNRHMADRFIERYPDHPAAAQQWEFIDRSTGFTVASGSSGPQWLIRLVDRGSAYAHAASAAALLERTLAQQQEAWRSGDAAPSHASTRGEALCVLVAQEARSAARPEQVLAIVKALPVLPADDPIEARRVRLRRRCELEIAAKRAPLWQPDWFTAKAPVLDPLTGKPLPTQRDGAGVTLGGVRYTASSCRDLEALDPETGGHLRLAPGAIDEISEIAVTGDGVFVFGQSGWAARYPLVKPAAEAVTAATHRPACT